MICEACGRVVDELWQAGQDREGRHLFVCDSCIIEPTGVGL